MEQSVLNYDSCLPSQDIAHFFPVFSLILTQATLTCAVWRTF
jgi:hypothetical protein